MAGAVRHAKLDTITARSRLKRASQPHWQTLLPGRAHLGYLRKKDESCGRWLLREYLQGRYRRAPLGRADDTGTANGDKIGRAHV